MVEPEQVAELAAPSSRAGRALTLPREQQPEPLRSMRLVDAAAVGATLVVTFTRADGTDDETVYPMPFDGPRDTWASRSTTISPRLSVVTPWTAR